MAIEFDVQVQNGAVKITVGGGQPNATDSAVQGGSSPGSSSSNSGGGGPTGGTGGPAIVGPIVIDGLALQPGPQTQNGQGGSSPGSSTSNTGGAGPSYPMIIGPIVITNPYAVQAPASTDPSSPQVVSICPPAGVPIGPRAQKFKMKCQEENDWCWAAVTVAINDFLDPTPVTVGPGGHIWDQTKVATQVMAQMLPWNPPVDCSADPNRLCNRPAGLDVALGVTANLRKSGAMFNQILDFASIQCWIDQQLPLGARILWAAGGAHFIAFSGYQVFSSGEQKVVVQDPLYGASVQDYSSLLGQYRYQGSWNDTYLVTP